MCSSPARGQAQASPDYTDVLEPRGFQQGTPAPSGDGFISHINSDVSTSLESGDGEGDQNRAQRPEMLVSRGTDSGDREIKGT